MEPYFKDATVTLHHGDCLDVLRGIPDNSVDAVVTDPPYSLTDRREQYCAGDVLRDAIVTDAQHSDAERRKSLVTLRIAVAPALAVRVRGVDLDGDVAAGEEEVDNDGAPGRQDDDMLMNERHAVAGEERLGGTFRLWVRQGSTRCIGACRCLGQHGDGLIRVPVRLRHDALGEAERSPGIVALGGAELAAVLALDVTRRTGELLPASGADALDQPFELLCPELVGAGTGAGRLASVAEAGGIGEVGDPADRALTFDLLAHRVVLSWRPIVLRGFMSSLWDGTGIETDTRLWRECLRVLKPGGHCLAFGSPRTWHNLQTAIEQSGFEIRDGIAWLSGSGFPKSLDVSKAIDKQRHDQDDKLRVTTWLADVAERNGVTRADVDARMGTSDMGGWWLSRLRHRCAIPTLDQVPRLLDVLKVAPDDVPDEIRALLIDLNGLKGQPGPAWFARVVTGRRTGAQAESTGRFGGWGNDNGSGQSEFDITAPATDAARTWQGWGSAMKPAHEPVVCARKPFNAVPLGEEVDRLHHLIGGLLWLSLSPAKRAALTSPSSQAAQHEAPCVSALVSAALNTSPDASGETATYSSPALASTSLSIVSSWSATLDALSARTKTSTTSTASSTTTALRTLSSLLGPITSQTTMPRCGCLLAGPSSPAPSAASSSSDEWAKWLHTLSASVPATATEGIALAVASALASIADELSDAQAAASSAARTATTEAAASRSAFEPVVVARKPFKGTLAANVLAHGTGALNIDACRIGTEPAFIARRGGVSSGGIMNDTDGERVTSGGHGRWPANVVLDESMAEALDQQSGELTSGKMRAGTRPKGERETYGQDAAAGYETTRDTPGDTGGASRFFYVARDLDNLAARFMYEAKAPTDERPRVNGVAHNTVKPIALMRWLVRLVTPPGGVVLEPFAGSGTTVEACILEGFRCIAIEREETYLPLIRQRIARRRDPVQAVRGAGEEGGLFDLLDDRPEGVA